VNPSSTATAIPPAKGFTRFFPTIVRILMGLPLLMSGLNGFLNFIPPPPTPLPDGAAAFAGALLKTGYMMQLIGATHLIVALLLLTNRFVPLALVLFAPFMLNSIAFHLVLERSGLVMAGVFLALQWYLMWVHRAAYGPLFVAQLPRK
jgi:hypothetical protein